MRSNQVFTCLMLICLAMLPVGAVAQDLPDEGKTQAIAKEAYVHACGESGSLYARGV